MIAPRLGHTAGMWRRWRRRILRMFEAIERPAAWLLLLGGAVTFVGVLVGLIAVGEFRVATLLISADLVVSGFGAVQEAENTDDDTPPV